VGAAAAATGTAAMDFATSVSRNVPGFGVLSIAGGLGSRLSGTALSTAEDLARAFVDFGIEQNLVRDYADALRQGKILIVVDAKTDAMARCAREVMAVQGAVSAAKT
jgi:hypothetical protein